MIAAKINGICLFSHQSGFSLRERKSALFGVVAMATASLHGQF
jgi:hypothetical protein